MIIKKGDRFKTTYSKKIYLVAGKWGGDIILSPIKADDEECLMYSTGEIEELIGKGQFIKVERNLKGAVKE